MMLFSPRYVAVRETYVPSMVMAMENSWSLGGVTSLLARWTGGMLVGLALARAARPKARIVDMEALNFIFSS